MTTGATAVLVHLNSKTIEMIRLLRKALIKIKIVDYRMNSRHIVIISLCPVKHKSLVAIIIVCLMKLQLQIMLEYEKNRFIEFLFTCFYKQFYYIN